jgi:hypothetical protein
MVFELDEDVLDNLAVAWIHHKNSWPTFATSVPDYLLNHFSILDPSKYKLKKDIKEFVTNQSAQRISKFMMLSAWLDHTCYTKFIDALKHVPDEKIVDIYKASISLSVGFYFDPRHILDIILKRDLVDEKLIQWSLDQNLNVDLLSKLIKACKYKPDLLKMFQSCKQSTVIAELAKVAPDDSLPFLMGTNSKMVNNALEKRTYQDNDSCKKKKKKKKKK